MIHEKVDRELTKGVTALLLSAVLFAGTACGSAAAAGTLDTTAARRDKSQQTQTTIIDDEAVALAGQVDQTTDAAKQAKASLDLVNQQREAAGLSDLTWNDGLAQAAQVRASECATSFSHTRPNGTDPHPDHWHIYINPRHHCLPNDAGLSVQFSVFSLLPIRFIHIIHNM